MRRWLVILMLALLPYQFSWAAVAVYCGHETGEQAQHFGHHQHQHQHPSAADQGHPGDDEAVADTNSPAGFDLDCGHCHSAGASLPTTVGGLMPLALAAQSATPVERRMRTIPQCPPERPQWAPLA